VLAATAPADRREAYMRATRLGRAPVRVRTPLAAVRVILGSAVVDAMHGVHFYRRPGQKFLRIVSSRASHQLRRVVVAAERATAICGNAPHLLIWLALRSK